MKKVYSAISIIGFFLFSTQFAFAQTQNACPTGQGLGFLCFSSGQLGSVIGSFITFAFVIVALIALIWLAWGGLKWLISQGEKQAVEEARNHIISAVIGLIVIFLSYLIVNVLLGFLTNGAITLNKFQLPSIGGQ